MHADEREHGCQAEEQEEQNRELGVSLIERQRLRGVLAFLLRYLDVLHRVPQRDCRPSDKYFAPLPVYAGAAFEQFAPLVPSPRRDTTHWRYFQCRKG